MLSASRSASAPDGFASSAACRDFGVSGAVSCARIEPAPVNSGTATMHMIDRVLVISHPSGGQMSADSHRPATVKTSLAPMLSVRQGARAIEFYKKAFGALEAFRM